MASTLEHRSSEPASAADDATTPPAGGDDEGRSATTPPAGGADERRSAATPAASAADGRSAVTPAAAGTDDGRSAGEGDRTSAGARARFAGFGLLAGAVYSAALAATHAVRQDPEVAWADVWVRAVGATVLLPVLFALFPRFFSGRHSRFHRVAQGSRSPAARAGVVLLLLGAVVLVALRSYRRMT